MFLITAYIVLLLPMIVSDIRHRFIDIRILIGFALCLWFFESLSQSGEVLLVNTAMNASLICFWLFCIWVYFGAIRHQWKFGILKEYLGIGDLMFLIVIMPCFDIVEFLFLTLMAMILSLFYWISVTTRTIPLVSFLGLTFILFKLHSQFIQIQ